MLRRLAIASTVVVSAAVLSAPAFADTVNIGGSVTTTSSVTSTATGGAATLSLAGEGTAAPDTVVKVADLALITNNAEGISLTAAADGSLTNGTSNLVYNVQIVGDGAAAPAAGTFVGTSHNVSVADFVAGAAARDLYIEYDAPALLDPGAYTSTITVTVVSDL